MDNKELLKNMLSNLINDRSEDASNDLHNYLTSKMKEISTSHINDDSEYSIHDNNN